MGGGGVGTDSMVITGGLGGDSHLYRRARFLDQI